MSGTQNPNPGNFANRPKEEVRNIARKGGQSSHSGGFASMDPEKKVCRYVRFVWQQGNHFLRFPINLAPDCFQGWSCFFGIFPTW